MKYLFKYKCPDCGIERETKWALVIFKCKECKVQYYAGSLGTIDTLPKYPIEVVKLNS